MKWDVSAPTAEKIVLFDYYGLTIELDRNVSSPIYVFGVSDNRRLRARLVFSNGIFEDIQIETIPNFDSLDNNEMEAFKKIVDLHLSEITKGWIDFFVFNKSVNKEILLQKLPE